MINGKSGEGKTTWNNIIIYMYIYKNTIGDTTYLEKHIYMGGHYM